MAHQNPPRPSGWAQKTLTALALLLLLALIAFVAQGDSNASGQSRAREQAPRVLEQTRSADSLPPLRYRALTSAYVTQSQTLSASPWKGTEPRVAVCLGGGIRVLELTADSIQRHFLPAYAPADVFIFAPLDHDSHKVALFLEASEAAAAQGTWRMHSLKFHVDAPLDEDFPGASALNPIISGIGVLLQTFEFIEGCYSMVQAAEAARNNIKYEWVIRARPDSYWSAPPEPLKDHDAAKFNVPAGSHWRGLNDRYGVAHRSVADASFLRLTKLSKSLKGVDLSVPPFTLTGGHVNGEQALMLLLGHNNVDVAQITASFCILTKHVWVYEWPLTASGVPVLSLTSEAPLNGAYCRPCRPNITGSPALKILQTMDKDRNRPFQEEPGRSSGWDLCNPTGPWPEDWKSLFVAQAGEGAEKILSAYAEIMADTSVCEAKLSRFLNGVKVYDGPPARLLCQIRTWSRAFDTLKAGRSSSIGKVLDNAHVSLNHNLSSTALVHIPTTDEWDGVSSEWSFSSSTCQLLFPVRGSKGSIHKKADMMRALQQQGWSLLKCGNSYLDQLCLLMHSSHCPW